MSAYVKTPKHSLQNKFKIGNIDEKKCQKMEVSKFLYFALVNFNLRLFTLWSSILFHNQFTDSILHFLHPKLVNYEISLDWMMSEAYKCYRQYRRTAKTGDGTIYKGFIVTGSCHNSNLQFLCIFHVWYRSFQFVVHIILYTKSIVIFDWKVASIFLNTPVSLSSRFSTV